MTSLISPELIELCFGRNATTLSKFTNVCNKIAGVIIFASGMKTSCVSLLLFGWVFIIGPPPPLQTIKDFVYLWSKIVFMIGMGLIWVIIIVAWINLCDIEDALTWYAGLFGAIYLIAIILIDVKFYSEEFTGM